MMLILRISNFLLLSPFLVLKLMKLILNYGVTKIFLRLLVCLLNALWLPMWWILQICRPTYLTLIWVHLMTLILRISNFLLRSPFLVLKLMILILDSGVVKIFLRLLVKIHIFDNFFWIKIFYFDILYFFIKLENH